MSRLLLLLLLILPLPLAAQGTLSGIVRSDSGGIPLAGVQVVVEGTGLTGVSAQNGRYVITGIPAGRRVVLFRSVGYHPTRMEVLFVAGDSARANALLLPATVVLEPLTVDASPALGVGLGREAFEERRRKGFGRFYDSTELRKSEHLRLNDLLRRKGGVTVERRGNIWIAFHPYSRDPDGRLNCIMQLYYNGAPVGKGGLVGRVQPEDLQFFDISSLDAVEVYRSAAQVPPEYSGPTAACGVILLWSRQGG